jgi:hypothetical protein
MPHAPAIDRARLQVPQGALHTLDQQYRAAPHSVLPPEMLVGVMTPAKLHISHLVVHLLLHLPKHARAHVTRHAEQAPHFCAETITNSPDAASNIDVPSSLKEAAAGSLSTLKFSSICAMPEDRAPEDGAACGRRAACSPDVTSFDIKEASHCPVVLSDGNSQMHLFFCRQQHVRLDKSAFLTSYACQTNKRYKQQHKRAHTPACAHPKHTPASA